MNKSTCMLVLATWAVSPGCRAGFGDRPVVAPQAGDVRLTLSLSTTTPAAGRAAHVVATVANTTDRPIEITSRTSALVIVRLWRRTPTGWTEVRQYPETVLVALHLWTLPADGRRTFDWTLTVEPDWPPNEPLRLTAEVNGHPARSEPVALQVVTPTR